MPVMILFYIFVFFWELLHIKPCDQQRTYEMATATFKGTNNRQLKIQETQFSLGSADCMQVLEEQ